MVIKDVVFAKVLITHTEKGSCMWDVCILMVLLVTGRYFSISLMAARSQKPAVQRVSRRPASCLQGSLVTYHDMLPSFQPIRKMEVRYVVPAMIGQEAFNLVTCSWGDWKNNSLWLALWVLGNISEDLAKGSKYRNTRHRHGFQY